MYRKTAWRTTATAELTNSQDQALSTVMQLLASYGPTAFLLKEDGETQNFKVCLGEQHTCTCPLFTRKQELCKHICWYRVLLCKFSLPRNHEYSLQLGLVEREILKLLQGVHRFNAQWADPDLSTVSGSLGQPGPSQVAGSVCRKAIQAQDVCPICQEELLQKKQPVSFCRFSCGNNVHISCMKMWANFQNLSDVQKMVKCPLCRKNFSSLKVLQLEVKNSLNLFTRAEMERPDKHLGVRCHGCQVCPVTGQCFKCTVCCFYYLCGKCVKRGCHSQHPLAARTRRSQEWLLVGADVSGELKEANCQPGRDIVVAAAADPLSDSMLESLPAFRVRTRSRLLDEGKQCRLCLKCFSLGQLVRTLPCFHKFHMDCVDPILRTSNSCPLDGYIISASLKRARDGTASKVGLPALQQPC